MMNYIFNFDKWGAEISLPACIVTDYIKTDGNYIKVLLCILSGKRITNDEEIAEKCGLSVSTVSEAVNYWVSQGVVRLGEENAVVCMAKCEPVSIVEAVKPTEKKVDKKYNVNYSQQEIRDKIETDENLKYLVENIQNLQFSINGKELGRLVELYELYHFDAPSILLTADYCISIGKRSIAYLSTVMIDWFEHYDISTYEDVEKKIIQAASVHKFSSRVLSLFGITSKPSPKQREYIESWYNSGISFELIEIAYYKSMDNEAKNKFSYANGIINKWTEKNISTLQQVDESDRAYKSAKDKKRESENADTSYDLTDYEQFALNFDLSKQIEKQKNRKGENN